MNGVAKSGVWHTLGGPRVEVKPRPVPLATSAHCRPARPQNLFGELVLVPSHRARPVHALRARRLGTGFAALAAVLALVLSACGDSGNAADEAAGGPGEAADEAVAGPLDTDDTDALLDEWEGLACAGTPANRITGAETSSAEFELAWGNVAADIEAAAWCDREDIAGGVGDKRQTIQVFTSEAARDTYLHTRSCDEYLYVFGGRWSASASIQTVATDLVEAGGTLCE